MEQTAVEWLAHQMEHPHIFNPLIEKALEMEKQQIIDAYVVANGELIEHSIPKEEQTKCYCGHTTYCDCGPEEPKQETLLGKTISKKDADKDSFEDVTKYKIERGYSEEDLIEFGKFMLLGNHEYKSYTDIFNEWFEQFKNK